jgi:hypothetical protein
LWVRLLDWPSPLKELSPVSMMILQHKRAFVVRLTLSQALLVFCPFSVACCFCL